MPKQKAPSSGAFLPATLMYFCSGEPMHFLSGVDTRARRSGACAQGQLLGSNPSQLGDARVNSKALAVERDTGFWCLADRLGPRVAQANMPCLMVGRLGTRESAASEQREVYSLGGIRSRRVANNLDLGRARGIGKRLAVAIVGHVHPKCSVGAIFALGQVDRLLGCVFS